MVKHGHEHSNYMLYGDPHNQLNAGGAGSKGGVKAEGSRHHKQQTNAGNVGKGRSISPPVPKTAAELFIEKKERSESRKSRAASREDSFEVRSPVPDSRTLGSTLGPDSGVGTVSQHHDVEGKYREEAAVQGDQARPKTTNSLYISRQRAAIRRRMQPNLYFSDPMVSHVDFNTTLRKSNQEAFSNKVGWSGTKKAGVLGGLEQHTAVTGKSLAETLRAREARTQNKLPGMYLLDRCWHAVCAQR